MAGGVRYHADAEMQMRTVRLTACVAMLLSGMVMLGTTASAQNVPLPRPAPPKNGPTTAAANDPIAEILRPPGSVPSAPASPATSPPPAAASPPVAPSSAAPRPPSSPPAEQRNATSGTLRPGETIALDTKQRALVDRVSGYLTGVQTLIGDFVQVGPDGGRTEGQFYIQKPGKVRFEYNPPAKIDVIADGQSVVVRDRNLATQDLYPLSQTPLRFLLSDHIDLLKETNVVSVSADDVFVTVVIEEKQVIIGTNRLMLMFGAKDFQLRQWTVTDPQGYDTTVAVYNLDASKKPDPGMFKITYERNLQ
jgi:outer membrane lipoprotein-sorting protein